MKRREGDQARGSSGPLSVGLGRVVLGATLALAGDAAREKLAQSGNDASVPPRQVAKTRSPARLPEPRFAEAVAAASPSAERQTRTPRKRAQARAKARTEALIQAATLEPLPESQTASEAEAPRARIAAAPEQPGPEHPRPEQPRPDQRKLAETVLAQALPEPATPVPVSAQAVVAPPVVAPPVVTSAVAAQTVIALPTLAAEPASSPPVVVIAAAPPQVAPLQPTQSASVSPPAIPLRAAPQPAPTAPVGAAPAQSALAGATPAPPPPTYTERLPQPAFGGPVPKRSAEATPSAPKAASAPKPASLATAPRSGPSPALAGSAPPAADTPLRHLASRSLADHRADLPAPAFGLSQTQSSATPLSAPALTAPVRANAGGAPGLGAQGPVPVISEDDELILQIETAQGELSDTVVAYGLRQGVYLPFGALTRFFDLPISISDEGHYASGWFLDEKRTLALNLRDGTLVVAGRPVALAPGDAVAYQGELYLRAERFGDLFPLDLKIDLRAQTIAVKTREPFPFEERMAREASRERLGSRGAQGPAERFPREETPWRVLALPVGETELRALSDDDLGARVEADLRLAGDLALMTARAYASLSSRDGLTAARLELGRRDPDGDLLGPLKATEFQIGDVATGALPIGLRGISGRGAFITNAPLEQASIFDSVDLRGDLLDGYEVELYRNNTLIGSTRTPVNGQYAFLQVPVDFGLNVFRLVFYGPQGQRREVVRRISVGDGRLSPGQFVYSVGGAQKDTNLFGVRGPQFSPAVDFGAWRATAELGYGLSRALTATLGAGFWQNAGRNHWLATTGLRSGIGATALRLDLGVQDGGGRTVEVGAGGKLLGMAYSLTHAEYSGGASDEVRAFTADPLRRASELNLNATLHLGARTLPLTSQVRRIEFADGRRQTNAGLRATLPLGGVLVSNTLEYGTTSAPASETTRRLTGTFDLATLSGSRTRLRGSLGYGVLPRAELQSVAVEADRRFGQNTLVRAGVTHTLSDHQTTLGLSAVRRIGPVNLAFDGSYGFPNRNFSLALRMGFSFGRNPLSGGGLFLARPGLTSGGAVALRAFADGNANGRFDPGEAPVAGVTFLSGTEQSVSDANGRARIGNLGDGNRASIRVDADSMPDIALAPARPGIEVVPRPGRIHVSDFAIVTLSDIEGTAYFRSETGSRAVSRLQLRLLRADGTLAARARSESDGFFLFERLPAGDYTLELDPQQAATLKIRLEVPVVFKLGGKSSVLRQSIHVKSAQ